MTVELEGRPCGCGNRGCLETVATDSALAAASASASGNRSTSTSLGPCGGGTLDIRPELDRTLEYLAVAAAAVINIFNPSKLFIYGRLFRRRSGRLLSAPEIGRAASAGPQLRRLHGRACPGE